MHIECMFINIKWSSKCKCSKWSADDIYKSERYAVLIYPMEKMNNV